MSRFKRIKSKTTKKSSVSINEKIFALNKELKKTGMLSEIMMTTSNVNSTSEYVPPKPHIEADVPDTSGITGAGFEQSSAGSGDEGDAPNYSSTADLFNTTANATIFPSTNYGGKQGYGIVIGPSFGAGTTYGIIEGGNTYRAVLGGHIAGGTRGSGHYKEIYDAKASSSSSTQEQIDDAKEDWQLAVQVEAALIKIGYDHTLFNVTWKAYRNNRLFEDLSAYPSYNHPEKGTVYLVPFSMLGTTNRYTVQEAEPETTINPIRRGLEDEPIYPGPIPPGLWPPLSPGAFNWLKKKGELTASSDPNIAFFGNKGKDKINKKLFKGTLANTLNLLSNQIVNGQDWNGSLKKQFDRLTGGSISPEKYNELHPILTNPSIKETEFNRILDDANKSSVDDDLDTFASAGYEPEIGIYELKPEDIPDEFKTDNEDKPSAQGVTLTKWMSRTDFMKMYPDSSMTEFLDALPYGATNFMKPDPNFPGARIVDTAAYERYFMTGNTSGVSGKPKHSKATPEPEQKKWGGKTKDEILAELDADIEKLTAAEKAAHQEMRSIALELGMDFVSLIGGLFTGGTTAAPVLGKIGIKLLKKYGKTVAGKMIRKLVKRFRNKRNSQQLDDIIDAIEKGGNDSGSVDLPDDGIGPRPVPPKPKKKIPNDMEYNWNPTGGSDGRGQWEVRDIPSPKLSTPKSNIPPKPKKKLPDGFEWKWNPGDASTGGKGKWTAFGNFKEEAKLGLYEPEAMNVDLADIRKGVMPEYPKKPPAEMIDGYHQDSKLKPKEFKDKYLLKIDEKDLLRNHRLKKGEADEMMNTIKMINDHLKKHPEDLIHAQMRYPIDDPRLAELNWKMDQMLEAGEEYLDNNFKENQTLYKRATDRVKNNVKLTDPEYVQQHYDELRGTTQDKVINPKPRDIKLKSKLKKHLPQYESKSFFKHVNSKDFKKISKKTEEKKLLEKESREYIESVMQQVKYSWREYDAAAELREGMTTADVTITQVPAQGEGESDLVTVDTSVADSFGDPTRDGNADGFKNTALTNGGSGQYSTGGFDIGPHLAFRGHSQPRWAVLNPIDSSATDTIVVSAIRGSDNNGGEIPDLDDEALQLWYYDSVNNAWRPLNQNPLGNTDDTVNHVLIPNLPGEVGGNEFRTLRDWTLTLPSWARGPEIRFMLYQPEHSGSSYDHYGIKSVSYRRNTPLTVFASLDSPEASAFIRMNPIPYSKRRRNLQDRTAPSKRKKNLEQMLEASDKYVATYLGPDFPGMNAEVKPITMQTFEQQVAAMEARDDLVSKIQSLATPATEKYTSLVDKNISDYHARHYRESANDLNSFGQMYQNAIDTQNYDQANNLVRNASKNVIYALGGTMPIFDKSGEVTQVPVSDRYGRVYNPNYKITQEQFDAIDARYGVTTESAMRARNDSPFSYTLNTNFETTEELLEDDSYDLKPTDYMTGDDPWLTGVSYSEPVDKQGGKSNTGSRYVPWYGGKGFRMFRGPEKPTTWDQRGWYPSRVGTNHYQGHRFDGLAYGAFRALYLNDERYKKTPTNGLSQAANLAYYLNYANTSWHFKTDYTKTITYRNGQTVTTKHSKPGTNRCGMSYFSAWMERLPGLREKAGLPPLTKDPLLAALREEQAQIPNVDEPIDQAEEGQSKDKALFNLEGITDDLTELDFDLSNEDTDGFNKDELDDMGNFWKDLLTHKPTRDEYDNTRSGAKKYSEDLKAYKQNQETIAKNTKIIDYYRNTLASIASRDENGKFDPEKYKAMFKEGESSFYINTMDYEIGEVNFLLGSMAESNPFGSDIAAFDKKNTLAYDFSNGINLGLSSQNMADLFGGGRKIVTAANGKSYTRWGDLDWEYKEDAINAYNAFSDSERDRLYYGGVDHENLRFGDTIFSTQQAFLDHLNLERAKSMNALNLMSISLHNRLVEVENGFNPVLGSKQDFGAMNDAGTKVSGQSYPPDVNFDLVPVDSNGFFTREFNANLDKPKGSNLTYAQIAQLNGQLSVVGDNGMRRLYQAQARGASEEELGAIAASIWQQEKPISDQLALDYDSMFSPDGKISPTLNSILNNPLSNAIKSLADVATFDTFDFDNKGRSTNPIANKINSSVRQLPGDAAMFIRYLTNTGPKVIDNKALGEKRVLTMFRNAETKGAGENALNFNDNIAGTTQEPVYTNGKINIAFNYDFEKNSTEFQTAKENNAYVESWAGKIMKSITGSDNLGNKILEPLTKAMYNAMGSNYSVDAQPNFPVVGQFLGKYFGQAIETSKVFGGAKAIPGNVSITPKELYRINPKLYREYVTKGVIPDTERDYYGGFNTGSRIIPYNEAPYFSKNKKKGEDEGTFDVNMNYFPPGFEDAIRTDEIGVTQGQFMPSNPPGMRQQAVGTQVASPQTQGEPIFPSAQAQQLTTTQSNALLNKGAKVERVTDLLNLGVTNKELNDLTKDIKVASHTSDKPLPKKLPSFGLKFKANLLGRYLTGNNKQFTEKDLDNAQLQSMYNQTEQILKAKDTKAFGMDNGVSVLDLTSQMSDERKAEYGMKPGEKIYQVSSYQGDQVLQPLENNDLIYVLGRYVVITQPGTEYGAPIEKIKEIRDDFDFEYGFNAVRADGGVPGSDDIIGRVKGDETPGVPGTLTKGKGIFGGGIPSEIGIRGAEPVSSLVGRSIVNIGQGLGVGTPFPIRIQFNDQNYNNAWKYEDDYPVYESKEPTRGKTLYEKVKKKVFFNPKDIKPEFPKDPPPKLDPETGMHPEYGKQAARYRKLDPHSADAMPETGDPEIDAEVMKQKSGKKKKKLSDFKRNIK